MSEVDARPAAHAAAERAARESFGRLVAWLANQWRDLAAAEDALADALLKALETWPRDGVPQSPDAWLLAVARRQLLQAARHDRVRFDPAVVDFLREQEVAPEAPLLIPDHRLELLFVCAHPAIDPGLRAALMLQVVLGLQANEIASAMLLSPAALAQRLVRAKRKIRDAGLRFEPPAANDLSARMHDVLEAIYGAFGMGVDALDGADARIVELQAEALYLAELATALVPESAEAKGLHALMLLRCARQGGQRSADGEFIALADQDTARWDRAAILAADQTLRRAAALRQPGPFQLEAAIQSAHCQRLFSGHTPWRAICALYEALNAHHATLGSLVAGAVAWAQAGDPERALQQLLALPADKVSHFQPWWVARAHVHRLLGQPGPAQAAYTAAIGLTSQPLLRRHLQRVQENLAQANPVPQQDQAQS